MTFASPAWRNPPAAEKGPPAEALAACKSLASGDACEFDGPQGKASGTCFAPQQGMALACRPGRACTGIGLEAIAANGLRGASRLRPTRRASRSANWRERGAG